MMILAGDSEFEQRLRSEVAGMKNVADQMTVSLNNSTRFSGRHRDQWIDSWDKETTTSFDATFVQAVQVI